MIQNSSNDFEAWKKVVIRILRKDWNYKLEIDDDTLKELYELDLSPIDAASEFYSEVTRQDI
jgi:hypothetical protein